jgi:hypothetical protein
MNADEHDVALDLFVPCAGGRSFGSTPLRITTVRSANRAPSSHAATPSLTTTTTSAAVPRASPSAISRFWDMAHSSAGEICGALDLADAWGWQVDSTRARVLLDRELGPL